MAEGLLKASERCGSCIPWCGQRSTRTSPPPLRQRWHKRAARMLDEQDAASAEVTVHLLAAAATGDAWVVDRLRRAAADARSRGAPDVAIQCLERALAEPPSASARGDVLFELGSAQTFHAPTAAVDHLTEALARATGWPGRGRSR